MTSQFVQAPNVEVAPMHGETVLFHPETNKFCLLNRTAALVWTLLQSPVTTDDLTREICKQFEGAEPSQVQRDVEEVLGKMQKLNFVVPKQ